MKWIAVAVIAWLVSLPVLAQPTGPGSALSFDGTGYVSIATTGSLTGTFTVELWANPNENSTADLLALIGSRTEAEFGSDLKFWLGHLIHGDIGNGSDWITSAADAEYYYVPGDWVHLAYVITPTNYIIYVNGLVQTSGDYPPDNPILYDVNHELMIGHIGYGSEYMNGQIDEVRIWNTARNQPQIQTNLQRRLTGSEPGLMGYWRFDEGSGPIVADVSRHGFVGTLVNAPTWVNSTAPIDRLMATTAAASSVTPISATLNGTIFPDFQDATAWFEYGTTTNYGSATAVTIIPASAGVPVVVSTSISGLLLGTLYHCRLVATNSVSATFAADVTFTAAVSSLVQNGGFETGDFTDWTLSGNFYHYQFDVDTDPLDTHSGTYGAYFGPVSLYGLVYLSQTLPTTSGRRYLISCWLDSPDGDTPNEFNVTWNGVVLFDAVNLAAIGWTNIQLKAVATTPGTSLQFGFIDDDSYLGFDDVSVVPIPFPEFLTGTTKIANGNIELNWVSLAGLHYQLQYAIALNPTTWNDFGNPITATNSTTTVFDSIGGGQQRFYRIVLIP